MKMEDYEIFCRKHLFRIQEEAIKGKTSFTVQNKNVSLIQFYGVPVLSPLLSLEQRKEIQQYKEKALELESRKRESRKKALLTRVQEIVENVQMKKGHSVSGVNTSKTESSCPGLDSKALTDFTALSDINSACAERQSAMDLEKTSELRPSGTAGRMTSNVTGVVKAAEENVSSKPGFAHTTPNTFSSTSETSFYLWGPSGSGVIKTSVCRPSNRIRTRWIQVFSPEIQMKFDKITAVAKGFLTRRLLQTEKLKHLKQTVKDTLEFLKNFQSEAPLRRGTVSAQDASLQERVMAQLRAALYDIHDIFFTMGASERMNILRHDREVRKEKMLRQMDKVKSPRERVTLSTATQKSLDRKKYMKASEMGIPSKKIIIKQKTPQNRILQPNQGQNAPVHRLLCRQGTSKASVNGVEQNRRKAAGSRVPNKAVSGAYAGRTQRKKPNVVII